MTEQSVFQLLFVLPAPYLSFTAEAPGCILSHQTSHAASHRSAVWQHKLIIPYVRFSLPARRFSSLTSDVCWSSVLKKKKKNVTDSLQWHSWNVPKHHNLMPNTLMVSKEWPRPWKWIVFVCWKKTNRQNTRSVALWCVYNLQHCFNGDDGTRQLSDLRSGWTNVHVQPSPQMWWVTVTPRRLVHPLADKEALVLSASA